MNCLDRMRATPGRVGFYYRPLDGEAVTFQADEALLAASVIKVPIMVATFRAMAEGRLDPKQRVEIRPEDKVPSCGALNYMKDEMRVTVRDLVTLMIILSDNTATNLLIDRLGTAYVNETMTALGIPGIALRRKMFDAEAAGRGLENTVTARGIGHLLERMDGGSLLGRDADGEMLSILLNQRLNGKLPFFLYSRGVRIAHKTGEDSGVTHDVGIVYAKRPFVVCMLSNGVDVPAFERLIQDAALELYERNQR